jgi:hypothetical protein
MRPHDARAQRETPAHPEHYRHATSAKACRKLERIRRRVRAKWSKRMQHHPRAMRPSAFAVEDDIPTVTGL